MFRGRPWDAVRITHGCLAGLPSPLSFVPVMFISTNPSYNIQTDLRCLVFSLSVHSFHFQMYCQASQQSSRGCACHLERYDSVQLTSMGGDCIGGYPGRDGKSCQSRCNETCSFCPPAQKSDSGPDKEWNNKKEHVIFDDLTHCTFLPCHPDLSFCSCTHYTPLILSWPISSVNAQFVRCPVLRLSSTAGRAEIAPCSFFNPMITVISSLPQILAKKN